LSDHAKLINNELLKQLKEEQSKLIKDQKVTSELLDLFHENLIFNRKIGHSEIVFNWRAVFMGSLKRDFAKNWQIYD
jgi:poly(A) polymerase Pap1